MRRLVEAPLKDFSKDLENRAKFLIKSHITATENKEQAGIIVSVFHYVNGFKILVAICNYNC